MRALRRKKRRFSSRACRNARFSSTRISPSFKAAALARASAPTVSSANETVASMSSPRRAAAGASVNFSSKPSPAGRPRWLIRMTFAPLDARYSIVGSAARMRVSSLTTPSLMGTLKSTRTMTRLPRTSTPSMVLMSDMAILLGKASGMRRAQAAGGPIDVRRRRRANPRSRRMGATCRRGTDKRIGSRTRVRLPETSAIRRL